MSCAIRRARSFVCAIACDVTVHDRGRGRGRRAWPCMSVVCVAVVVWPSVSVVVMSWRRGRGRPSLGCDHSRGRGSRPSPWLWWPRRFFVSPSCGCDTPTNASVSNGLCLNLRNSIVACILITTARRTAQRGTARPGERRSEPLRFDNSRADAMKIRRMAGQGLTLKDWTAEPLGSRNEWRGVRHGIAPRCMSGLRWP